MKAIFIEWEQYLENGKDDIIKKVKKVYSVDISLIYDKPVYVVLETIKNKKSFLEKVNNDIQKTITTANNGLARIASLNLNRKSCGFSCITFHNNIFLKLPQRRPSRGNVSSNLTPNRNSKNGLFKTFQK